MKAIRRVVKWASVGISALFILVLIGLLLSPWLLNVELVKQNILSRVERQIGGRLAYQKVDILFLPRPYLNIQQAQVAIPDSMESSLTSLKVYPQLLPLLQGDIQFSRIDIEQPRIHVNMPDRAPGETSGAAETTYDHIKEQIISALALPLFHTPGLIVRLIDGELTVISETRPVFIFKDFTARIRRSPENIHLKILCTSNVWKQISLTAQVNATTLNGSLQAQMKRFRPHLLSEFFLPDSPLRLVKSQIDLDVGCEVADKNLIRVNLQGSNPSFVFQRGPQKTTLRGKQLKAVVRVDDHSLLVSLGALNLVNPQLNLSGSFYYNSREPEVRLDVSGIGVEVTPLRKKALALAGDVHVVGQIFEIITGGHVPAVTVNARARSFEDLNDVKKFIVKGTMSEGRIHIPVAELDIEHAKGEVVISEGILKGKNIKAQLGNSSGKNGELTLGLISLSSPFRLEIETLADVAQIKPILARLVPNEPFRRELERIGSINGEAIGKLIIGDRLDDIHVSAIVSQASLSADYERIPYPIMISNGQYYFDETHCVATNVEAGIGRSSFSNLSFEVDWSEGGQLKIDADQSRIALPQLVQWLSTFKSLQPHLKRIDVAGGSAILPGLHLQGPLYNASQWEYSTRGSIEALKIRSALFADAFSAGQGRIQVRSIGNSQARATISPLKFKWGDSRLAASIEADVSGTGIDMDAYLSIDTLDWNRLSRLTEAAGSESKTDAGVSSWDSPITGVLKVHAAELDIGDMVVKPAAADIIFQTDKIDININQADLCGISVPGKAMISARSMQLDLQPLAVNQDLGATVTCLWQEEGVVTGDYRLSGKLKATKNHASFVEALAGNLDMQAGSGRIYRLNLLAKILALVNVTEIIKGRIPDVFKEGFAYKAMRADGYFKDGDLILKEGIIEGVSMTIYAEGKFNFVEQTMDLTILVSPFKTIDSILQKLPLLKKLADKGLIAFWYSVQGKWDDYEITAITAEEEPDDLMR